MILYRRLAISVVIAAMGFSCTRSDSEQAGSITHDTVVVEKIVTDYSQIKIYQDSLSTLLKELEKLEQSQFPKATTKSPKLPGSADSVAFSKMKAENLKLINEISQLQKDIAGKSNKIAELENALACANQPDHLVEKKIKLYRDSLTNQYKKLQALQQTNSQLQLAISKQPQPREIIKTDSSQTIALRQSIKNLQYQVSQLKKDSVTQTQNSLKSGKSVGVTRNSNDNETKLLNDSISKLFLLLTEKDASIDKLNRNLSLQQDSIASYLKNRPESREVIIVKTDTIKPSAQDLAQKADKQLAEAFRIFLLAKAAEKSDPTLALRLNAYASQLSNDSIISNYQTTLKQKYIFYQNIISAKKAITHLSIGASKMVAILAKEKALYYDITDFNQPQLITEINDISCAEISAKKGQMILGRTSGKISIFSLSKNEISKNEEMSIGQIASVGIIGNPNYYWAIGGADKTIRILDKSYRETARMVGMKGAVNDLVINPNSGLIASACGDLNPRLWNAAGKLELKVEDQADSTLSVALSPSKNNLLSTHANGHVRLWAANGALISKFIGHQTSVTSSAFGSDQILATGDRSGLIFIWNEGGTRLYTLKGHKGAITSLIFLNATTLFSSSNDGTVKVWDLTKNQELIQLLPLSQAEKTTYQIK